MKTLSRSSLLFIIIFFCLFNGREAAFSAQTPDNKSGLCINEYTKIVEYYKKSYAAPQIYFKFSSQKIIDSKTGDKLTSELWLKGHKFKYSNDFVTIFQDTVNQVLILKDSRKILIKKADLEEIKNHYNLPSNVLIDSLVKISTDISCTQNNASGNIVFKFPKQVNKKPNLLKEAKVFYNLHTGELTKGEFDYFSEEGQKKDIIEYIKLADTFDEKILAGSAVSKVLSGKVLKNEFKGYELRDIRVMGR